MHQLHNGSAMSEFLYQPDHYLYFLVLAEGCFLAEGCLLAEGSFLAEGSLLADGSYSVLQPAPVK